MSVLRSYITFLKEYKKLLERGVRDILSSRVSDNFIWNDDIFDLIEAEICDSTLPTIFTAEFQKHSLIFSLKKPIKPNIQIPKRFEGIIEFDDVKNKFEGIDGNSEELLDFQNSKEGKEEIEKLNKFKKNKDIYSKLYRAYNDIKNDSNLEIVLSVGFIQYSSLNNRGNLLKINQHLFHFPLSLNVDLNNVVEISFSSLETPYVDFAFLNNTPVEKEILTNIIDKFEQQVTELGYEYIFENDFKDLIAKSLQQIAANSEFKNSIYKPEKDYFIEDFFKISFSPSINIKQRKPRFFEKLTDSIITYSEENDFNAPLFNLLARDSEALNTNEYPKSNYFIDELFKNHKPIVENLNGEEDFSVFFPLPFNKEQKQIYENYLKNRLTVVTGPPGTGKSHTIVNILCSLLAQGKRVLVTAQTDKALESLLDKIPKTFDDLIFTKIQLETNENRFSLEKSIENISRILTEELNLNIEQQIRDLDKLKAEYIKHKSEIIKAFETEYIQIAINESFNDLRAYQIVEKFESKNSEEWNWIQDELSEEDLSNFELIRQKIENYKELVDTKIQYSDSLDINISSILDELNNFDFKNFLSLQENYNNHLNYLKLTEYSKDKVLEIQLEEIINITNKYSTSDIVLKNIKELKQLQSQLKISNPKEKLTGNKTFNDLVENGTKYLLDIETYLSFVENGKAGFLTRLANSNFKQVKYLEQFTINGTKCNNNTNILKLKSLIEELMVVNDKFNLLKKNGYSFSFNDNSNLSEKHRVLNEVIEKVKINNEIISQIQFNSNFINLSEYCDIDLFDIEQLSLKAISLKEDFNKLQKLTNQINEQIQFLQNIDAILEQSQIKEAFSEFIPVNKKDIKNFEQLKEKLLDITKQIETEQTFTSLKEYLNNLLPNTFELLKTIPNDYILKENFEYASANKYLKQNKLIDLQKHKEKLSFINKKIFQVKCDILFDLAKTNFKNKFNKKEIESFLQLLRSYAYNLSESDRQTRDKTRFQIATRKNSIDISKRLSCWVMKFNDVLNSVGAEPEIFDCIIVDEASQLDFNSIILSYYAKNMIIVGDDKQTSPSSLRSADGDDFESIKRDYLDFLGDDILHIRSDNSLFMLARMVSGTSDITLKEHFRCVPELIEFSKLHFYNNSLRPLKQINSNRLNPKEILYVADAFIEDNIVYKEIKEIKRLLQKLLKSNQYVNKTIGVVSLGLSKHTEKLKDIKEDLESEFGKETIDQHKLIIEDSTKFQGDERDVMIISLGVALDFEKLKDNQNAKPRAIVTSQAERRKINVALSRAKEQMILVHSVKSEDLRNDDFRNEILNFFYEEIRPIEPLQLDNYNIERDRYNVPTPFDSWFEYDIAKSLIEKGYSYIQPQYKVKEDERFSNPRLGKEVTVNFRLDLVVHNNGKVVAIECDGDPFHSLPEDVEYDIERQEFLERVGWKVYRILYSAYKRTPKTEIEKLVNFIEEHTKKDQIILIPDPAEQAPVKEIKQNPNINTTFPNNNDEIEEETHEEQKGDKILRYFNLNSDGTYILEMGKSDTSKYSIPLYESDKNGFLLQGYENGHLNKVFIATLLAKQINRKYKNGLNSNANLNFIETIKQDEIIGLYFKEGEDEKFKAHLTRNIATREQLHLQGYKVIYKNFSDLQYKIIPLDLLDKIERLVFKSFTASGKVTNNPYYNTEWKILKPNQNFTLPLNRKQKVKSILKKAIEENKKIKIFYKNKEEIESERILSNLKIVTKTGISGNSFEVLKADCSLRRTERYFKIDRIKAIEIINPEN